ncbi:MAG TPA: chemotaxis protein CheW [Polyangiaceae bacterium]
MTAKGGLAGRATELRRSFDRSFADPPRAAVAVLEDLLTIRVAGDPYALCLAECAGLFADRKVTPLPTTVPELLGLAGSRGALVPVYDLGALLGYPRDASRRWLVTTAGSAVVGLAFDEFEAHVRIDHDAVAEDDSPARRHADRVAHLPDGARRVLRVASILDSIDGRAAALRQGA